MCRIAFVKHVLCENVQRVTPRPTFCRSESEVTLFVGSCGSALNGKRVYPCRRALFPTRPVTTGENRHFYLVTFCRTLEVIDNSCAHNCHLSNAEFMVEGSFTEDSNLHDMS
jgi:hypothetical protein